MIIGGRMKKKVFFRISAFSVVVVVFLALVFY